MERSEAREKFKQADELYKARKYEEALKVLEELDAEFPNLKNVIYPKAMCLARLRRWDEAIDLCKQLKVEFGDTRADPLMQKIIVRRREYEEAERQRKEGPKAPARSGPPPTLQFDSKSPVDLSAAGVQAPPLFDSKGAFDLAAAGVTQTGDKDVDLNITFDPMDLGDGSPVIDSTALDDLFAVKSPPPPKPPERPLTSRKYLYGALAAAAALIVVGLLLLPVLAPAPKKSSAPSAPPEPRPEGATDGQAQPAKQYVISWIEGYERGIDVAYDNGEPLLLYVYSGAQPDTQKMEIEVFADPSITHQLRGTTCAKVDIEKEPEVRELFNIQTLPTILVLDTYDVENPMYRGEGYMAAIDLYNALTPLELPGEPEEYDVKLPPLPWYAVVLAILFTLIVAIAPLYTTLALTGNLPADHFAGNITNVAVVGIVAYALLACLGCTVIGGLVASFVMLRSAFQIGIAEYVIYIVLTMVMGFILYGILNAMTPEPVWVYIANYYITQSFY